jgi:sigma-B regulation protein RsbU (phosphoserine phosphatase)
MTAHAEFGTGARRVEVFAYSPFDDQFLAKLVQGLSTVYVYRARDILAGDNPAFVPVLDSTKATPAPRSRGFWDMQGMSSVPVDMRFLDTGRGDAHFLNFYSRPSAVLNRLLSPLGSFASAPVFFMLFLAGVFLAVELIAVISSAKLTRSLTRTIHDIYTGTRKIETGDFSHRIPIRTKDQLSELATSFNSMTEHIERLIVEVKEKEKLESELEIARQVQAQLFPKDVPKLRTLELKGLCNPARVVSGDYYDFIPVDARFTALVIGDISGKGISAALLMASIQSSLHAQLTLGGNGVVSTATLVARLNRQLYENTSAEKYATFYCGVYDDQNGSLVYTNAGHLPPILIRRGKASRLAANGMVVGMFPDSPYEQSVIELQSGDLLTAFTDGITESEDGKGEQFGEQRLTELLIRNSDRPLDEIVQIVTQNVRDWAYDLDNQDDTTMLLARRL